MRTSVILRYRRTGCAGAGNEAVPLVEAHSGLVDGVDDDEPGSSRLPSTDGLVERLSQEQRADAPALVVSVNGEASDEDHSHRVGGQPAHELGGSVGPQHRPHGQAEVAHDPTAAPAPPSSLWLFAPQTRRRPSMLVELRLVEIRLTAAMDRFIITFPMARILTAERTLQGQALSSFGAYACQPGSRLHSELKPGRRDTANTGRPVVRW